MPKRSLWNLAIAITALAAVVSGTASIGHAAGGTPKALEPGFSGTFLYRNDNFRTGQNLAESVLTPSNVNPQQFGLIFTDMLDGAAYAEPLYVPNVAIPGNGTHNVVYVATENDSVYAFDADNAGAALWHVSFIDPANGITAVPSSDLGCNDLTPIIGITATPVIDSGTLYVVSKVKLGPGDYQQQLHALDITTGPRADEQSGHDRGDRVRERAGRRQRGDHLRSFAAERSAGADDLERRGLSELRVALRLRAVSRLDSRLQRDVAAAGSCVQHDAERIGWRHLGGRLRPRGRHQWKPDHDNRQRNFRYWCVAGRLRRQLSEPDTGAGFAWIDDGRQFFYAAQRDAAL